MMPPKPSMATCVCTHADSTTNINTRTYHDASEAKHGNTAVLDLSLTEEVHVETLPVSNAEGVEALYPKSTC